MSQVDQKLHPMRAQQPVITYDTLPANSVGGNGDVILVLSEGNYYQNVDGVWTLGGGFGGGSSGGVKTLRNMATRCRHNYQVTSANQAIKSRSLHVNLGSDIAASDGVQVVVGNWIANNTGETAGPATSTEMVSLEYPAGFYTMATFAGAQSVTCAAGSNVTTDPIKVAIPKGATFFIHRWESFPSAVAIPVSANAVTVTGESATTYSAAQLTALTVDPKTFLTGTTASGGTAGGAWTLYPLAVLGMSSAPSVIGYGDSRMSGRNDAQATASTPADFGFFGMGEIFRSIGHLLPYTNCGCESDTILQFNTTHTFRANLAQYHTHVHVQYGINDLTAGRNAATIEAALQAAYALFPTKKISANTIPPVTTSSDSWATVANQTVSASNPDRILLNNYLRGLPAPLWACFEVADVVENARDGGKWKGTDSVPAMLAAITGDGTHANPAGYWLIQNSGAINPTLIV